MTGHASIEPFARRLRELVEVGLKDGISVAFVCELKENDTVLAHARVFGPEDRLPSLNPVLRCAEIAEFGDRALAPVGRAPGHCEYECTLGRGVLRPDSRYHLTLHLFPGAEAAAAAVVHTFSKRVVTDVRRRLCDIVLAAREEAPPKRRSARSRARR